MRRRKRLLWLGACSAAIILVAWLIFFALVVWLPFPSVSEPSHSSTFIQDRAGALLAAFASDDGQWRLPLTDDHVSPHLLHAIIAAEDARFYEHHGVDWKCVASAAWQDLSHLRITRGASTITMQVQRMRQPKPRTFLNKVEQAIRAEQLERQLTKPNILLEYINSAPFGGNLVGAGAASWRYFGRSCEQLSLAQAALLAGLPQSPNRLRPDRFPERARLRRNHVLNRMLACGFISKHQHDEAFAEPIEASWKPLPQERTAPDASPADGALPALVALAHQHPGQTVRSTFDAAAQRQTYLALRRHLDELKESGIGAAVAVVLDTQSSQCLATVSVGGPDNLIDLATRPRSTGSTLKPFIYAAAFDAGILSPGSILSDAPAAWAGYQPSDYDRSFRGPMTAAEALAESRNVPAMLVLSRLGVESGVGTMDAMGLHRLARDPQRFGLTLAIGGAEASPLEMAEAYATLARGGISLAVGFISGHVPSPTRSLRPHACWQVLGALSAIERTLAVCPQAGRSHIAWKTGTSSGHHDAWCAAVTHRRTVIVWLGNTGGEPSPALVGQEAAAPLALQLIAMFDPADEPWPVVPERDTAFLQHAPPGAPPLTILSPSPGQQFVMSADLPPQQQKILLQASNRSSGKVWWFIDDQLIAKSAGSEKVWWNPLPGAHEVRVIDDHFQGAVAKISVANGL